MGADVAFVGETPEAMSYMAGTDVYVLPSWRDASPRVVRERYVSLAPDYRERYSWEP